MIVQPPAGNLPHGLPASTKVSHATNPVTLESHYEEALRETQRQREAVLLGQRKTGYPKPTSATNALLITASALAYQCGNVIRTALGRAPYERFECTEIFYMSDAPPADDRAGMPGDPRRKFLRAFGFVDRDNAYLVFKGTQTCRDWLLNLQFWMIGQPARHAGFHRAWRSINSGVQAWLKQPHVAGKTLHLAGHSLGGAMAVLASYELAAARIRIGNIVTVGQPRVGGRSFKAAYAGTCVWNAEGNPLLSRFESHVHGADPVPWKPPAWLGFSHVQLPNTINIQWLYGFSPGAASETTPALFDHRSLFSLSLQLLSFAPGIADIVKALLVSHSNQLYGAALDAVAKHKSVGYVEVMAPGTLLTPAAIYDEGTKLPGAGELSCWACLVLPFLAIAYGLFFSPDLLKFIGLGIALLIVAPILIWNWIRG